jgi:hypothetical protein
MADIAQIGLFCKLLAGCSFTVGVVTSCWKVASLELAFASVAGCRSRMTAGSELLLNRARENLGICRA